MTPPVLLILPLKAASSALCATADRTALKSSWPRDSTVAGADRIIILDHGRVAAQGKHDQLLESCELYRELYRSQIGDEAVLS